MRTARRIALVTAAALAVAGCAANEPPEPAPTHEHDYVIPEDASEMLAEAMEGADLVEGFTLSTASVTAQVRDHGDDVGRSIELRHFMGPEHHTTTDLGVLNTALPHDRFPLEEAVTRVQDLLADCTQEHRGARVSAVSTAAVATQLWCGQGNERAFINSRELVVVDDPISLEGMEVLLADALEAVPATGRVSTLRYDPGLGMTVRMASPDGDPDRSVILYRAVDRNHVYTAFTDLMTHRDPFGLDTLTAGHLHAVIEDGVREEGLTMADVERYSVSDSSVVVHLAREPGYIVESWN